MMRITVDVERGEEDECSSVYNNFSPEYVQVLSANNIELYLFPKPGSPRKEGVLVIINP